jgi:hypothetical protein
MKSIDLHWRDEEMLKLLLVDDESFIRKNLRTAIDWKHYSIEIVAEAQDGFMAGDHEFLDQCLPVVEDMLGWAQTGKNNGHSNAKGRFKLRRYMVPAVGFRQWCNRTVVRSRGQSAGRSKRLGGWGKWIC